MVVVVLPEPFGPATMQSVGAFGNFFCLSTAFLEKFKTATHIYDEEAFNAVLDRVYSSYINLFDNFKMALEVFQTFGISKAKLAAAKRLLSTCCCFLQPLIKI